MSSLPVRVFHAFLLGSVMAVVASLAIFQFNQNLNATPTGNWGWNGGTGPWGPSSVQPVTAPDPTTGDTDGDGIPDTWEEENSHMPTDWADSASDFDFDGLTAKQEYDLSVQTDGEYGRPLGKFELSNIPDPPGYAVSPTTGLPLITSITLLETARNGMTLMKVVGTRAGATSSTTRNFTYHPATQAWTLVLPPSSASTATLTATDVNSQGQVVGYYTSSGLKGFIWSPSSTLPNGGESKQYFLNPTTTPAAAFPRRISDTGYTLYSTTTPTSITSAADYHQRPITVLNTSWANPVFMDVNDYGEYVGRVMNPVTGVSNTFIATPDGRVHLSEVVADDLPEDEFIVIPNVDEGNILWNSVPTGDFTYGTAVDEVTDQTIDYRRSEIDSSIWWVEGAGNGNTLWQTIRSLSSAPAALNDWGEFAGKFTMLRTHQGYYQTYDENWMPTGEIWTSSFDTEPAGTFLFNGAYHLTYNGGEVLSMSNDPQILLASGGVIRLWSDGVNAPLDKLLPAGASLPTKAKICDNGLIVLQKNTRTLQLLTPDDDADGDGMPDDWEAFYGFNPAVNDAHLDFDDDGTNNFGEFLLRTDPTNAPVIGADGEIIDTRDGVDTDHDGIPNSWEVANGLDYTDSSDAPKDFDRDGYTNLQEFHLNTDPRGAPSYRVREPGAFTGATSAGLATAVLGNGLVSETGSSQNGGNITDTLFFSAQPATTENGGAPLGVWSLLRSETEGNFAFFPSEEYTSATILAQSPSGATFASGPTSFLYWSSPTAAPIELSGAPAANNIGSLISPKLSPSGKYLVATRTLANAPGIYQPVIWKMPVSATEAFAPVVLVAPSGASFSAFEALHVNDEGYVAGNGTTGGNTSPILWHVNATGTAASGILLPPLAGGASAAVIGISNQDSPVIAGTSTPTGLGGLRATVWNAAGTATSLGTLPGGYSSSAMLISPGGLVAGSSSTANSGEVPFIAASHTSGWRLQEQPAGTSGFTLKSLTDAGEILGTADVSGNAVPTLWRHGRVHLLDSVYPPSQGGTLNSITAISPHGTLLGKVWKDGALNTILLTPDGDTDGDGLPDAFENQYALNAFHAQPAATDSDADGLTDLYEYRNGTNPKNPDTDGDGLKDDWEVSWGLLPLDPSDAALDPDGDRVTNLREYQLGTIPTGIYRIETRVTGTGGSSGTFLAADDQARIIHNGATSNSSDTDEDGGQTEENSQQYFVSIPAGITGGPGAQPLPPFTNYFYNNSNTMVYYWTSDQPTYRADPVSGEINGSIERVVASFNGVESIGGVTYFLVPDAANNLMEEDWIPWADVEAASSEALEPAPDAVSPSGNRRIHHSLDLTKSLVLDEAGQYIASLDPAVPWSAIDDGGQAFAVSYTPVAASGGVPAYDAPELRVSSGDEPRVIAIPHKVGVTASYGIEGVSGNGTVLLSHPVKNAQLSYVTRHEIFDIHSEALSPMRKPGIGYESAVSMSADHGRILGDGPKAFQITPDGTCVRMDALRIQASPSATPVTLGSLYTQFPVPRHIASDGRITVTKINGSFQNEILQIIPSNDQDSDGVPDDWEIANGVNDGTGDADDDDLTDAQEFAAGSDPLATDTDGDGISDGVEVTRGSDPNLQHSDNDNIPDGEDADPIDDAVCWRRVSENRHLVIELPSLPEGAEAYDLGEGGHVLALSPDAPLSPSEAVGGEESPTPDDSATYLWRPGATGWGNELPQPLAYRIPVGTVVDPDGVVWGYAAQALAAENGEPEGWPGAAIVPGKWSTGEGGAVGPFEMDWTPPNISTTSFASQSEGGGALVPNPVQGWLPRSFGDQILTYSYVDETTTLKLGGTSLETLTGRDYYIEAAGGGSGWFAYQFQKDEEVPISKIVSPSGDKLAGPNVTNWLKSFTSIDPLLVPPSDETTPTKVVWADQSTFYVGSRNGEGDFYWTKSTRESAADRLSGKINARGEGIDGNRFWRNGSWRDIASLLPVNHGYTEITAVDINDAGLILATATKNGNPATLLLPPVDLGVDNNRDGSLDLGSEADQTIAEKPYRFWLNNDHDNYGEPDTYDAADDHPWTNKTPDNTTEKIESERDVEDFTRLHLKLDGIRPALEAGTMTLGFKWKSVQSGTPKIRLFKAADVDGGTKYLSTMAKAADQVSLGSSSLGVVEGANVLELPVSFWTSTASSPTKFFLYEGLGEGKGELSIVIKQGTTVLGEGGSVFLDILDIRKMYERWKIDSSALIENPDKDAVAAVTGVSPGKDDFGFPFEAAWDEDLTDKQYVICVHGWRKNYYKATSDEITMFKRLWHRGFKGRYIGFKWPTYDEPGSTLTSPAIASKFNHSEFRAWKCGEALKTFVSGLPASYSKKIFAHSLGNVVVGSALEKGMNVSHYALLNAAIPASCYDKGAAARANVDPDFTDDTNAAIRALSYRGDAVTSGKARLESVSPVGVITNFHLSSDSALTGSLSWEGNQDNYLGQGKPVDGYDYEPSIQVEWDPSVFNPPVRVVTDPHEAMSMVNQSKTKAAGAVSVGGRINANNDMNGAGMLFDKEHEAAFKWRCCKTWVFYGQLWDALKLAGTASP